MNICFFTTFEVNPYVGGLERVTYNLSQYFIQHGIGVYYFHSYGRENESHFILPKTADVNIVSSFIINKVRENNIQIVIDQYGECNYFSHEYLPSDIKIIRCLHQNVKENYITRCLLEPFFYKKRNEVLTNILFWLNTPRRRYKKHLYYKYITKNVDVLLLLSESFKEILCKRYPNGKMLAIKNATNIEIDETALLHKENVIMFCGRIVHNPKNILFLIYLWDKLYKKYPHWRMEIVGDGEDRYVLEKLIKKYKLERINLVGNTNPVEYYKKAKILVLPSYSEGFPMVLLEGMSFACIPIVFNTVSSFSDLIINEDNGFIVERLNKTKFVENCERLMTNEVLLKRMQTQCLKQIENFTIDKIGKQWLDLFNSLTI